MPSGHLSELGTEWIQMLDPEGNEVCVCKQFEDTSSRPVLGVRPALHEYVLAHERRSATRSRRRSSTRPRRWASCRGMQIAPEQGDLMRMLTQLIGARHALEVGTFTGYSALCIARGSPTTARCSAATSARSGRAIGRVLGARPASRRTIDLRIAPALDTLRALPAGEQFDLAFIDADKPSYAVYFDELLARLPPERADPRRQRALGRVGRRPEAGDENVARDPGLQRQGRGRRPRSTSVMLPISDGLTVARKR